MENGSRLRSWICISRSERFVCIAGRLSLVELAANRSTSSAGAKRTACMLVLR